ncbi:Crp/Fnr family transcriptional regulator [Desulfurivibrio alkaliphilus]|uniref:Putative transcriptional regulator, Crp/Fnr family n=1 Tax=Desulfurivibrio alkaliphilus (strain DSM 19089 / UNIQEM U267 / AHT2) TaxID=589865 RepID=D6Z365_DESAT|nr:cyclic nucleotide-binding domain-containing protein [Desulfurivibrio alkaliphilus]ADH85990.1 putative transcriptional regulator, Crp/Fnr family [Desulfurivibrio alkaliphilus AHT 2]
MTSTGSAEKAGAGLPVGRPPGAEEATKVLAFLEPAEALRLKALGEVREWKAGEVILDDQRPAPFLAFVLAGRLAVKKLSSFPGRYILLAEFEPGGMIGEGAVVEASRQPAAGTVVAAVDDSRLLVLPRERLQQLLSDEPELAQKLLLRIIQVVRRRLQGAGERLAWIL